MTAASLDELQKKISDAKQAFDGIDQVIGQIDCNPADFTSLEAATREMEQVINERISLYPGNQIVLSTGLAMKEQYRKALRQRSTVRSAMGWAEPAAAAGAPQRKRRGPSGRTAQG